MARTLRSFSPGVVFHVTARIQCRAPLLLGLEGAVVSIIRDSSRFADARLIAYVVMPNHLHIVIQQRSRPLGHYMQPLLRRVALLVQRRHAWEGHVFERRYRDSPCLSAEYLRNAITYVHLNGLRARLADSADAHRWCSHTSFFVCDPPDDVSPAVRNVLRVFSAQAGDSLADCRANYRAFVAWRMTLDAHRAADKSLYTLPNRPSTDGGDEHWATVFAPCIGFDDLDRPPRPTDLRDLAMIAIRELDVEVDLEALRSGWRTAPVVRARRHVIARARAAGHRVSAIARFLRVSCTTVSLTR